MTNLTLSIPKELKNQMQAFPEINWSEVARQAIIRKAVLLQRMNQLLKKSSLDEEDIEALAKTIRKRVSKKHTG